MNVKFNYEGQVEIYDIPAIPSVDDTIIIQAFGRSLTVFGVHWDIGDRMPNSFATTTITVFLR